MALKASYSKTTFHFNFDARTSRGQMKEKESWFVKVWDERAPATVGFGECGPLPGLSIDHRSDFGEKLGQCLDRLTHKEVTLPRLDGIVPSGFPSILFGIETAINDLANGGRRIIFDNKFNRGLRIPINGLVWMGDFEFMFRQIEEKISKGFTCIKLKVGGIDFDLECDLLRHVREKYPAENLTLRLDANGAFSEQDAMAKLEELSKFRIHSIEQPVKAGLAICKEICRDSPIPIALDEELIGLEDTIRMEEMLDWLKPQFIVIKPTLHGGLTGAKRWIQLSERRRIGWWITSALESNIGLNAICQFTANYPLTIHHGLGTGSIYVENVPSPLTVESGSIFLNPAQRWDVGAIAMSSEVHE